MREQDIENIVRQLTSFYREYLPIGSALEELLKRYIETFEMMWEEAHYHHQHVAIETAPTLKRIPYAKIDVARAVYDKQTAGTLAKQSFEEVIAYLNDHRHYAELSFNERKTRTPVVYSLQLKRDFFKDEELRLYEDYFLRDNRIYLLPSYVLKLNNHLQFLHAANIRVDNFFMEQKWGHTFQVEGGNFLPRHQYRDVLSAFRRMMLGKLTIRDMVDAVKMATKWETFNIQDIKSPHLPAHRKRFYDEWLASPSTFLVLVGEDMIKDKMLLNILIQLMDEAKETQTYYLIIFLIFRLDIWDFTKADEMTPSYLKREEEQLAMGEGTKELRSIRMGEFLNLPHAYDVGRSYDYMLTFDYPGRGNKPILMDDDEALMDTGIQMDAPWFFNSDYYEVRVSEFPKIPRGMQVAEAGGVVTFTFNENGDGTKQYELYGRKDETEEFVLLSQKDAVSDETNTIIHDAGVSGMRYYKVRATFYHKKSLFTLVTDIQNL